MPDVSKEPRHQTTNWHAAIEQAARESDDIHFAREVSGHTIPHWSHAWPRIAELQRAGLLRVRVINRWMAEVEAIGAAKERR